MKRTFIIMAAVAMFASAASFQAKAQENAFQSYVAVTGFAEKEVAPDTFYIRINLDEADSKGKVTIAQQQKNMIAALKKLGINTEEQLKQLSLSSTFYKKKSNLANASYELKVKKSADVSKVLQALDELAVSNVSFTKAEYSDIKGLREEVRKTAVQNAKAQAASMAEAIEQKIGKCFYINSYYEGTPAVYARPRMAKSVMLMDAMSNEAVVEEEESVEFGNIKVSATVETKFVLE